MLWQPELTNTGLLPKYESKELKLRARQWQQEYKGRVRWEETLLKTLRLGGEVNKKGFKGEGIKEAQSFEHE